ncbi:hypothetical protein SAMN05216389_11832 [Oceanobacillus limi]|uniref:Serine hydrolase family protein n=1 Tax=Oceanobacillus limi TaxID=930131 RepID=A0A1I0FZV5_9BACI|nr:hypothetical protein SAMN05216389_11832 [Oceanobacillus limi]
MSTTVLFIHSAGPQGANQGSSNLIAYLEKALKHDFNFVYPNMPSPEQPAYLEWKKQVENELHSLTGEVILVGHSLGGSVLLKYLSEESYTAKITGLFVIAAPYWGMDENWQLKDFVLQNDFEQHFKDVPQLFLYHSRDEEIVPFAHHLAYAKKLPQAQKRQLEGTQHLFHNGLPELLQDIKSLSMT